MAAKSESNAPSKSVQVRTIALEEHIMTPQIAKLMATYGGIGNPPMESMAAVKDQLSEVGAGRIADMDAAGIDVQVLSLSTATLYKTDSETGAKAAHDFNDALAGMVKANPTRFAAFGTLNMQEPIGAAREFERCVSELGFQGVMIEGSTKGLFLDDVRFAPVLETAQKLDMPIYLHPAPPPQAVLDAYYGRLAPDAGFLLATSGFGWHADVAVHSLRMMVSGVFDRYPDLKFIIGHMGELLPYSIARADSQFSKTSEKLKRTVAECFQTNFWLTTAGYFTIPPFLCALEVVGADRLMFSIDYPWSQNMEGRNFLNALPVSPEDLHKIAHGNAERLLKLR